MRLTLIRHPQTEANEKRIIYGKLDYPYSTLGKIQFDYILDYVRRYYDNPSDVEKSTKLYTSPSQRTQDLAIEIGKILSIPFLADERIAEMNFGIFEGLTINEIESNYPEAYNDFKHNFSASTIPEGESYKSFVERIEEVISDYQKLRINQINQDETIVGDDPINEIILVTHGAVIREFIEKLLVLGDGSSWKFVVGNACIVKFDFLGGEYRLKELISSPY